MNILVQRVLDLDSVPDSPIEMWIVYRQGEINRPLLILSKQEMDNLTSQVNRQRKQSKIGKSD